MEKIDLGKFFGSFANPVAWFKTVRFAIGLAALILVGFTVYKAYFVPTQKNSQTITIEQGGTANIVQSKTEKTPHGIEPFLELYGQINDDKEKEGGVRCGVKFY